MSVTPTAAAAAYNNALQRKGVEGLPARNEAPSGDFAAALTEAAEGVVETLEKSESESLKAAAGKADIGEVVMAVSQAEITLETVVAIRDRVIQAYQDILRMPI